MEPAERAVDVADDQNLVVVRVEGQHWVSVVRDGVELSREAGGQPVAEFVVEPGSYLVRTDGTVRSVDTEHRDLRVPASVAELIAPAGSEATGVAGLAAAAAEAAVLRVEVEAPAQHPVDGMAQVPADGESACTVRLEKVGADGERLSGRGHTDEIYLRTTGGLLRAADGDAAVRSVRLRSGQAAFRLVSESVPKVVTVYAFAEDAALRAEISLEFV